MDRDFLDTLRERSDIVRVISRYVPLTKRGRTHWGSCPFHHEKTPSFSVSEDKQFYHCFGCKESGNVFNFLMKIESIEFMDAVKILASEANMVVPQMRFSPDSKKQEQRLRLTALMRDAALHYHHNLKTADGQAAMRYLDARGIGSELITKFGLGASANSSAVIEFLRAKGYTESEMRECALIDFKNGRAYDVFYNRLIIPILNAQNEVIAFGGRLLESGAEFAKYRNSAQSVLFDKSKALYAVNLVKKTKQEKGISSVIVAEGYMDVIALFRAGFTNAVASMGTALTVFQARSLCQLSENVVISFDGDAAGGKGAMRGLDILRDAGANVRVADLPKGLDPDDVIRKFGAEKYAEILANTLTLPEFKIRKIEESHNLKDIVGRQKFAKECMSFIRELKAVEREDYTKLVSRISGYSEQTLIEQADELEGVVAKESVPVRQRPESKRDKSARFVLASMLNNKPYVDYAQDIYIYLADGLEKTLYQHIIDSVKKYSKVDAAGLFLVVDEQFHQFLGALIDYEFIVGDDKQKYFVCINNMKYQYLLDKKNKILQEYNDTGKNELLYDITALEREILKTKAGGGADD